MRELELGNTTCPPCPQKGKVAIFPCSNQPSRVRSGRVLGRCHTALGQRELSSAALEAALGQARAHRLLWSESLVAREMGLQQQGGGGGA